MQSLRMGLCIVLISVAMILNLVRWDINREYSHQSNIANLFNEIKLDIIPSNTSKNSAREVDTPLKKWIPKPQNDEISCCAWDEEERSYNSAVYCDPNFKMSDSGTYRGMLHSLAFSGGHSCACTSDNTLTFYDEGQLEDWNASLFCKILGNRTMMLVGDSTMQQTASALMSRVTMDLWEKGCQEQLIFAPGDTLVNRDYGVLNRGRHWAEWASELRPGDILVLSAGPHILSGFEGIFDEVMKEYNKSFRHIELIWRSQFPGGCAPFPFLNSTSPVIQWQTYFVDKHAFNYKHFASWDAYAASKAPRFLDLTALYARPDAHVGSNPLSKYPSDCLHFCQSVLQDFIPRTFLGYML